MPTRLPPSRVVSSGPRFVHVARADEALGGGETAPRHQHEAHGDVGDVVGQHVRRVGHLDAALPAVVDRHAVVADAEDRDDLELRQRVEQRRRRDRAAALDQAPDARALGRQQTRLVGRLVVVVAAEVALQRFVEERRQRRGDDEVDGHGGILVMGGGKGERARQPPAGAADRAAHSSKPASSPASPPAVSIDGETGVARVLRDARMRDERRHRGPADAGRRRDLRPQVVEALAAGQRDGVDAAFGERLVEAAGAGRLQPRIAGHVVDLGAARDQRRRELVAAGVAAKDRDALAADVGEFGQREQSGRIEASSRECATSAMPSAASASAVPGPGA